MATAELDYSHHNSSRIPKRNQSRSSPVHGQRRGLPVPVRIARWLILAVLSVVSRA